MSGTSHHTEKVIEPEKAGFMGLTAVVVTAIPLMAIQLVFLVLTGCTEGDKGENEYGPDPLEKKK